MKASEVLDTVKAELQRVNDDIAAKQAEIVVLQARKQELRSDRDDLQAFVDSRKAQP